ncbi:MAG: hypothetical protein E6G86_15035 [Alphaproteobacteria bacterium]|nr:MAG: hypothetical protein E6G86_15035 [Alphaproteobacteria bacterium]TMJ90122.1 MAG: hypothetical protein E6G78_06600 [Alphaproteobacteria bacterium]TMK02714.1 MAG: hypothetical protein E6G77_05895 [Alphaproteobacteria bacterium]
MSRAVSLKEAWRAIGKDSPEAIIRVAAKAVHAPKIIAATARLLLPHGRNHGETSCGPIAKHIVWQFNCSCLSKTRVRCPVARSSAATPARNSFLSPSPIVFITVLYFSAVAIFQALVERFAFLDYANGLQDVGYLFGLNNDCLTFCLASPSNGSQFVLGKPFANVALSKICFPLFIVGLRCPCCQEQCSDTG